MDSFLLTAIKMEKKFVAPINLLKDNNAFVCLPI